MNMALPITMHPLDGAHLIATLIPSDDKERARTAFLLPENKERHQGPTGLSQTGPVLSSHQTTPEDTNATDEVPFGLPHRLRLRWIDGRKIPAKGITFGSDPNICDVLLTYPGITGISGLHFFITFDREGHLYLRDESSHGMAVSYDGQAKAQVRRHFTWRLDLRKSNGRMWSPEVHVPSHRGLSFKIRLPMRHQDYLTRVSRFLEKGGDPSASLGGLDILNPGTQPPRLDSHLSQRVVFVHGDRLGGGGFSSVYRLIDSSNGFVYVGKYFHQSKGQHRLVWLETIRRQVQIMKNISHVSKSVNSAMRSTNSLKGTRRRCF